MHNCHQPRSLSHSHPRKTKPVITLFVFTLLGLVVNLIGDMMYVVIDPRIDFERREV